MVNTMILGGGIAGLSVSYHIGHDNCLILEKNNHPYGHIHSEFKNGFTWDEGPHISFTKNEYVKKLFAKSVENQFDEYEVKTGNYYKGYWIDHPAQSNLYQIPEPLRTECLNSFLQSRQMLNTNKQLELMNYAQWLELAFGKKFADTFPAVYTRKYWTTEPKNLTTAWVGKRVFYPKIEDVVAGSKAPLSQPTHYITTVRYPKLGGYQAFANLLVNNANIRLNHNVEKIDLKEKKLWCQNGNAFSFTRLISTIPLPIFVHLCKQATPQVLEAADSLSCSQLLIINVEVPHSSQRAENWLYVYDENKYATRINFTENLTTANAPEGHSGIQVEVYFSKYKPFETTEKSVAEKVIIELLEMGLINRSLLKNLSDIKYHTKWVSWANIIFDHYREEALDTILEWLTEYGLIREEDDLEPATNWDNNTLYNIGSIILAGRFGQWKYYWTDDSVLRGKQVGDVI
jgi:protoporphyrinogen oxidase